LFALPFRLYASMLWQNVPEPEEAYLQSPNPRSLALKNMMNLIPMGFGSNQNANFDIGKSKTFVIVNPDISFGSLDWAEMCSSIRANHVGLMYPNQQDTSGNSLDCERELVTPWAIIKRHAFRQKMRKNRIDWVPGAFMAFRSDVFRELGGFDKRYFMYCEDVDICLRLQMAGYKIQRLNATVVHDTRRNTLKSWRHLRWHLGSLIRLWCSPVFWRYLKWRKTNNGFIDHEGKPLVI
jgi:N-acetylglucosaminyl-diphospho-decaprenol L-rhamnosyltransferase